MNYSIPILLLFFCFSCNNQEVNVEGGNDQDPMPNDVPVIKEVENSSIETAQYKLTWNWDGEFNNNEKAKLKSWITRVNDQTNKTLGHYAFDVDVTFIRSDSEDRPVPFGFTRRRDGVNQVHLYVNPDASLSSLMEDWTAAHEFSHLSLPFLGKKHKWFSEGFATFLSRQTMMDLGLYTQVEFDSIYHSKIAASKVFYNSTTKTFIEVSDSLISNHSYSHMYWGSTSFFLTIDKRLRNERSMRFVDVLKEYQRNYRSNDKTILDVIRSFDKVIGEPWCVQLMKRYRNEPSKEVMKNY